MDAGGVGIAARKCRARHIRLTVLGRFLEIGIATADIRASVEFYERLGFTQAQTGDIWPHPYGVLTDGRVCIGLHQRRLESPALTFVHPGVAERVPALERLGIELSTVNIGSEVFHEIGFRDPAGLAVRLLEARTYSPVARSALATSSCGQFRALSLPAADFDPVREFWETLGFIAEEEQSEPYAHLSLRTDAIPLALHRPRFVAEPLLVFGDPEMPARIAHLRELGIGRIEPPPKGLDAKANALLFAPEGTALLLRRG
jgi:catechol 2,3-dioxygenase-like lactoylglutathione lyase family enzyme